MVGSKKAGNYSSYAEFARALYETGILSDPWLDGNPRFELSAEILSRHQASRLNAAAERVAYIHHELVQILLNDPELLESYFRLTPVQLAMWQSAGGMWHGMGRADLFLCADGSIKCCELNSDTPSGQAEAVVVNTLLKPRDSEVLDPNRQFRWRFLAMLRASLAKRDDSLNLSSVGIVYPTELTEDLSMIILFSRWLESEGIDVVSGSPYNIHRTRDGISLLGKKVDLVIRHYKTDWWGERLPVWADSPGYADVEPLYGPLSELLTAEMEGQVTVVNPFGAVITQNKLSLAFFWEYQHLFSPKARSWIRKYIPETRRMAAMSKATLISEQQSWVLKSDYGCEGEETVCGPFVSEEIWRKTVEQAIPEHFVAQMFFSVRPDAQGRFPNHGVYVIAGRAAGNLTRLSPQSTGYTSVTVPTFVRRESQRSR